MMEELELESLHIKNYRLFQELKIDKLGQVNLIAGKNNTGKTALLEALRIWKSDAHYSVVNNIIQSRGFLEGGSFKKKASSLFDRNAQWFEEADIYINHLHLKLDLKSESFLLLSKRELNIESDIKGPLEIWRDLDRGAKYPQDSAVYIHFSDHFSKYEDYIEALNVETEDEIVQILQIIDKNIIDFRPSVKEKQPLVRLKGSTERVPLKYLGDGANRLFMIALALTNAKGGMLLIDEFEVGLHHSVQEQLWDIIFYYAWNWHIQVFVTTHSQDTVKSFMNVWDKPKYQALGNYFRLQKNRENPDIIEPIYYEREVLEVATQKHIETR
jgi:AAA15 family ATPase/GTPase